MSSSQDVPQNLVPIRAPTLPSPQIPEEPVRLCETCQNVHDAALRDDSPYWEEIGDGERRHVRTVPYLPLKHRLPGDMWPNLPRLHHSAQAGCEFCASLREAILSHDFKDIWPGFTEEMTTETEPQWLGLAIGYGDPLDPDLGFHHVGLERFMASVEIGDSDLIIYLIFRIEATTDCPAVAEWLSLQPPTIQNHEDDTTTSFLTKEMQKVTDDESADYLPKRLINVDSEGSSLCLVERSKINADSAKRLQYAALSYCWGPREHAKYQSKTTSKNLNHHLERLDFDALPPVLKDAIKVTRSLSIPYLWVDSLCILQDQKLDWQEQCSQMKDIYGKARVTIIAASSTSCKEGFLNPRRHGLRFPYQSARRPGINGSFMMYFSHVSILGESPSNFAFGGSFSGDLHCNQWARRGWTFQEYHMAGARILFGKTGVYFLRDNIVASKAWDTYVIYNAPKFVPSVQSNDELHRAWEEVMIHYSRFTTSSFTDPTDLLPALSGLARLFGEVLKVDYIAGHWVDRLHLSMVWRHQDDDSRHIPALSELTKRRSQKPYLIPSWSSFTSGILDVLFWQRYDRCRSEVTILDVHKELVGEDPYGALNDAYLTLEGYVLDLASLSWSEWPERLKGSVSGRTVKRDWMEEDEDRIDEDEIWFEEYGFDPEVPREVCFTIYDKVRSNGFNIRREYFMRLDFRVEPGDRSLLGEIRGTLDQLISRATLLLLGSEDVYSKYEFPGVLKAGYGLVLVPWEGAPERSFLRVGIFQPCSDVMEDSDDLPCLKRLMKKEKIKIY